MKNPVPVQILYHGTSFQHSRLIEEKGLIPVNHNKVYLTADVEVAYHYAISNQVEHNDYSGIVVCIIDAPQMVKDGFTFEHNHTYAEWVTDNVPAKYLVQILIEDKSELELLAHYTNQIFKESDEE